MISIQMKKRERERRGKQLQFGLDPGCTLVKQITAASTFTTHTQPHRFIPLNILCKAESCKNDLSRMCPVPRKRCRQQRKKTSMSIMRLVPSVTLRKCKTMLKQRFRASSYSFAASVAASVAACSFVFLASFLLHVVVQKNGYE